MAFTTKLLTVCLCVLFACFYVCGEVTHFHNHKVVRAYVTDAKQADFIEKLQLDVWSRDGLVVVGDYNDFMVPPQYMPHVEKLFQHTVLIDNVENLIQQERATMLSAKSMASFHESYHSYDEIVAFLTNLTSSYPSLSKFVPSIGLSIQGRNIPAVEITGGKAPTHSIFLSGGQHAREWIAPATVLYIIDQLVSLYGKDSATTALLDKFSFYIVPLVNPDGYEFTRASNRLWRKNRRQNTGGSFGVDLNRNWDEHWCQYGASTSPSSDTYCGTVPFSEPETKATATYIAQHPHSALIDFHSYGQLILRPYGWTVSPPPTETLLKSVGDGIAATIRALPAAKVYTSEHGADLYPASGAADDWSYTVGKIPLVYTIELRDTGSYGFQLPANQIISTGDESYAAIKYLGSRV